MSPDDNHLDVLQNIEFAIISVYRERSDLSDYAVMRALDALIGLYRAEFRGHVKKPVSVQDEDHEVFERVQAVCEWRLGRGQNEIPVGEAGRSVEDILTCLMKVRKSAEKWNKRGGPTGYLTFVREYV